MENIKNILKVLDNRNIKSNNSDCLFSPKPKGTFSFRAKQMTMA